jgi:hypothetical protein
LEAREIRDGSHILVGDYVHAVETGRGWIISMREMRFSGPVFAARWKRATGIFMRNLTKLGADDLDGDARRGRLVVSEDTRKLMLGKLRKLDARLLSHLEAPLSPREVETHLDISGRERIAWTKDGRLPSCQRRSSSRSSDRFLIPFFSAELVHHLRQSPDIIEEWRAMDRQLGNR